MIGFSYFEVFFVKNVELHIRGYLDFLFFSMVVNIVNNTEDSAFTEWW